MQVEDRPKGSESASQCPVTGIGCEFNPLTNLAALALIAWITATKP